MKKILPWLFAIGALAAVDSTSAADAWHVPGAVMRERVERSEDSAWPADVGHCLLWLDGKEVEGRVVVVNEAGKEVPHQVFWCPPEGEPCKVVFDCSDKANAYYLYVLKEPRAAAPKWEPHAGIMLETRKRGEGRTETWEQTKKLWDASLPVYGRSFVNQIFQGWHIHGPTLNTVSYYRGYLQIAKAGKYDFAPISQDAAFIFIDGELVAEWPGRHEVDEGRRGEFNGSINLSQGLHKIEYYNVRFGVGLSVTAAWRPPGRRLFEVIPPEAFVPAAEFETVAIESPPGKAPVPYFTWRPMLHSMPDDKVWVTMEFRVPDHRQLEPKVRRDIGAMFRWTFDDGSTAKGLRVQHLFLRPGLRTVRLDHETADHSTASLECKVLVTPLWTQRHSWHPKLFDKQRNEVLERDLSKVPVEDLAYAFGFADEIEERDLLTKIGTVCLERRAEFSAEHSEMFRRLAEHFAHPDVRAYTQAERAYRAALDLSDPDSAQHQEYKLELSHLLLRGFNDAGAARALLDSLNPRYFTRQMNRRKLIYEGDLLLAEGHPKTASERYTEAGVVGYTEGRQAAVRRRAWVEMARDYVSRTEFDAAADLLERIGWQTPLERLDSGIGLILIDAYLGRKEYPLALSKCHMLLNTETTERDRSALLYRLVEVNLAMQQKDAAREAYKRLIDNHPYTEAAARAADEWAGVLGGSGK